MDETIARTKWRGFPETRRQHGAIAATRQPPFTRVVRPARPESGRRPDGSAGLPDASCVLARMATSDGHLYFAFSENGFVLGPMTADGDAAAIALARERCGSMAIACDTMMEDAARIAGVPVRPLPERALTMLTVMAMMPVAEETMTTAAFESCDVMRFLFACAGFAWAQVWRSELAGHLFEVVASGRGGNERYSLVIQPDGFDPGPGFGLLDPEVELAADPERPGLTNAIGHGRLSLVCTKTPERMAPLLVRALGTDLYPIGISYRSAGARLNANEVRLLTGVLECFAELTTGAESATTEVDRRMVSLTRHPHDALLEPELRGTA